METTMKRLRCCIMLLLVMTSVLVGVCQSPKTGFSAHATSLNFYFNDDPSVYPYTGQPRAVTATVQISIVIDGTFIPGVHTHPSWTVSISGPNPNNPQQTTTLGSATFTHPGPYTNANVSVSLPATAGAYTYTASLTGGEGTATPVSDDARIVAVASLMYKIGTGDFAAMPGTLYVAKETAVTFKAIPNPTGVWPSGKPVWGGTSGATGTGETMEVIFPSIGEYTLTSECGNTVTANITVVEISKLQYANGQGTYIDVPASLAVPKGANITFKAIPNPSSVSWPMGTPEWSSNNGVTGTGETKMVSFPDEGIYEVTATCGSSAATASVLVYSVSILNTPEICAGAKTDDQHQGKVIAMASADGIGIKDVAVTFTLGNLHAETTLNPTLLTTSATTNDNGVAEITMRSGNGVLDGSSIDAACVTVTPSASGVSFTAVDVPIGGAGVSMTTTDPDSGLEVTTIATHGGIVNINTILEYNEAAVNDHQINISFKFFATEQENPDTAQALFDSSVSGLTSDEDIDDEMCDVNCTLYGKLSAGNGTTDNGTYTVTYTSGSQEGVIYIFIKDTDTYVK